MGKKELFEVIYARHALSPSRVDRACRVPAGTTDAMREGKPVKPAHARVVLDYLTFTYEQNYTLETVAVTLFQPLEAILTQCHLEPSEVASLATLETETVLAMLRGTPVSRADAERLLAKLSECLRASYTLETVEIALREEPHAP